MATHAGRRDAEALADVAGGERAVFDEQGDHGLPGLTVMVRVDTAGHSGTRTSGGHGADTARRQHNIVPHGFHNTSVT